MRILNALMAEWKTRTTAEKIKLVLHGIAMIGGGAIGGMIGDKCAAGRGPMTSVCTKITGFALGSAISDAAAKSMDETVDTFNELIKARQKSKTANKEDFENA